MASKDLYSQFSELLTNKEIKAIEDRIREVCLTYYHNGDYSLYYPDIVADICFFELAGWSSLENKVVLEEIRIRNVNHDNWLNPRYIR